MTQEFDRLLSTFESELDALVAPVSEQAHAGRGDEEQDAQGHHDDALPVPVQPSAEVHGREDHQGEAGGDQGEGEPGVAGAGEHGSDHEAEEGKHGEHDGPSRGMGAGVNADGLVQTKPARSSGD